MYKIEQAEVRDCEPRIGWQRIPGHDRRHAETEWHHGGADARTRAARQRPRREAEAILRSIRWPLVSLGWWMTMPREITTDSWRGANPGTGHVPIIPYK
jgi:hypothetical protein